MFYGDPSTLGVLMRVRATAAVAAMLLAAVTGCGGSDDGKDVATKPQPATPTAPAESTGAGNPEVDCSDESLSQADWIEHCAEEGGGTGGDGTAGRLTGLKFGESFTWPDGLKVSVVDAKEWTKFVEDDYSEDDPEATEFRIRLKITNGSKAPVKLDDLSTFIDGATNGGEASTTQFVTDSDPLEGRLAPGVTVTKTDDNSLESRYGKKIVVTVQRSGEDFPEFEGEITG
ncbi:hypothetical protein [Streptomyces sp. SID8352]|uniref:hypothetical protein n=1 Tax=Streptomyces sp. SID8352 TaxID=2690338 RepID=UPI001368671B|nr:hypothetical protein [Streptomyces sp. SID8352]MYU24651.1 hypothetical protein [Streptomyces sp. SID8352]